MMDNHNSKFNPYHKFLGIPVDCTSPNYYVLLGISLFENDVEVISNTADGRTMFLRSMQTGKYAEYIHRLLNEVAKARVCLLNPAQKREYDQQLRNEQTSQASELQISSSAIAPVLPPKSTVHKSSEPPVTSAPRVPEPPVTSVPRVPEPPVTSAPRVPESSVKSVAPVLPSVTSSPLDSISDVKSQTVDHNSEDEETLLFLSAIEQETPALKVQNKKLEKATKAIKSTKSTKSTKSKKRPVASVDLLEFFNTLKMKFQKSNKNFVTRKQISSSVRKLQSFPKKQSSLKWVSAHSRWFIGTLVGVAVLGIFVLFLNFLISQKYFVEWQAEWYYRRAVSYFEREDYLNALEKLQSAWNLQKNKKNSELWSKINGHVYAPGTSMIKTANGIDYVFCWCPAGSFIMGSSETEEGHRQNETQHPVTLTRGFWMLESEVTVAMFRSFVEATGYRSHGAIPWRHDRNETSDWSRVWQNPGVEQKDDMPICCVSWFDAIAFCKWLGEQLDMDCNLPTEAQWEYACRAGTEGHFGGTGELKDMAVVGNPDANRDGNNHPVKQKNPNQWGLYDMHGGVFEWCYDWNSGNVDYDKNAPSEDPQGGDFGIERIHRGRPWNGNNDGECRSATRVPIPPRFRAGDAGFRVALSTKVPNPKQYLTPIMTEEQNWSYVLEEPTGDWTETYPLPGGTDGFCSLETERQRDRETERQWDNEKPKIWLTTELILPVDVQPEPLAVHFRADNNVQIYINGECVAKRAYTDAHWRVALPLQNPLHAGKNVIAAMCENTDGPGYVDLELYHGGTYPHVDLSDKNNLKHYFVVGEHDRLRCVKTKSIIYDSIYDSITVESGTKWNKYGGQGDLFMTVSADGKFMCRADMDGVVRLWDVENGNVIRDFGADSGHIAAITLDGKKVIRSIGRVVYVWGAQTGQKIDSWELPGNDKGNSNNIALSIDGRYVALTYKKEEGDDRTTGIWDIRTKQCICEIPRCGVLCFSPDGTKIGSTGGVWDIATGERLYDNPDNNYSFAWSPMGNIVAFSTYGSEVYIRDAEMGDLLEKFKVPGNYIWTLSFSSDGEYLAATHGMIRVSGKLKRGRKWTNSGGEMVTDV